MEDDLFSLTGLVAVVVGGGGVLAGAMATGLAQAGADVAILDVNLAHAEARAESIAALGGRPSPWRATPAARPAWRARSARCSNASRTWTS